MTAATAHLDAIEARSNAATEGPWELAGGNEWLSPLGIDVGSEFESNRPTLKAKDAEFIAHARTDVPHLLTLARNQHAALEAVEALHQPQDPTPSQPWVTCAGCTNGGPYPCPTIKAIRAALGDSL